MHLLRWMWIEDVGWTPGLGRPPGAVNGSPLQYSCLENSMDRGTLWATIDEGAESDKTKRLSMHAYMHALLDFSDSLFGALYIHVHIYIFTFELHIQSQSS